MSGFENSKTAPVSLDSCLVIDTDCHKLVTDQLSVTLTFTFVSVGEEILSDQQPM